MQIERIRAEIASASNDDAIVSANVSLECVLEEMHEMSITRQIHERQLEDRRSQLRKDSSTCI